ncbi:hypothetical protein RRG08_055803 [Elysia crispata]|uniref:Uncharacterized protein n=1 Tax=Elysia crispata TaxID=231223 RepID=A0AAE0Z7W9_9GAST|nr:hypothetical protein RRG08_055803 [Elysia crispata]
MPIPPTYNCKGDFEDGDPQVVDGPGTADTRRDQQAGREFVENRIKEAMLLSSEGSTHFSMVLLSMQKEDKETRLYRETNRVLETKFGQSLWSSFPQFR